MSLAESKAARRCGCASSPSGPATPATGERMAVSDRKLERFRILNGWAGDRLNPGDLAKIVVE